MEYEIDEIEQVPIKKIKPYEKNAKLHPPEQIEKIAKSITEFGFSTPILIDKKGVVIAGHGRLMAAIYLGMGVLPCIRRSDLTAEQVRRLRMADNRVAESGNDIDMLLEEIGLAEGFTGYSDEDVETMRASREVEEGVTDINEEWEGMPEFEQDDSIFRSIIVHFEDQDAVDKFAALMNDNIGNSTKFIWYPEITIARMRDKGENLSEYASE